MRPTDTKVLNPDLPDSDTHPWDNFPLAPLDSPSTQSGSARLLGAQVTGIQVGPEGIMGAGLGILEI